MFIPILLGTGRENNKSSHVANFVLSEMKEAGIETEIIRPRDVLSRNFTARLGKEVLNPTEQEQKYKDLVLKADSFVVVTPEYNRSYPGELKLMIDLLYPEYKGKKFHMVGVSDGPIGGARAVDAFSQVVVGVEGIPVKPFLFFTNVNDVFDEQGNLINEDFKPRVEKFVDSLTS